MRNSRNSIDAYVGCRLQERRVRMGLSRERLGEKVGLTGQQIQKYETGANRISASKIYEIAKILQVKPSYFFDEIDKSSTEGKNYNENTSIKGENFDIIIKRKEIIKLINAFDLINDNDIRRSIINLVSIISGRSREKL